ncbi:MAG: hypothetical protein QOC95_1785, partial [Thermoleophilaceae bacterium]|nr:hypothetical protein [Thermoleophilaceae bacterium]
MSKRALWRLISALVVSLVAVLAAIPASAVAAPQMPGATTLPASNVTATSAKLNGTVYPGQQATTYYFEYGTSSAYGTQAPQPPASAPCNGNAGCSVSLDVSGLQPSTTYHYRLVATNPSGTVQGSDVTFSTCASGVCGAAPPAVTTGPATPVYATTATVTGTVNPEGQATTWQFQYGTTTAYGSLAPDPAGTLPADTTDHGVSADLAGLTPSTTYHYRLVATNPSGTVQGADQTFITPALPPPPSIAAKPDPMTFGA